MAYNDDIISLIPQRPPFVMIDRLIDCSEEVTNTVFTVRADNVLVHMGELTEAGLIENIAQTAAAGSGYLAQQTGLPIASGYIASIKNLEIFALPKVDDVLETYITVVQKIFDVTVIEGTVKCKGTVLAQCEMKIFIQSS